MSRVSNVSHIPVYRTLGFKLSAIYLLIIVGITGINLQFSLNTVVQNFERSLTSQFQLILDDAESTFERVFITSETWAKHLANEPDLQQAIIQDEQQKHNIDQFMREHNVVFFESSFVILTSEHAKTLYCTYDCRFQGDSLLGLEIIRQVKNTRTTKSAIVHDDNHFSIYSISPVIKDDVLHGFVIVGKKIDDKLLIKPERFDIDMSLVRDRAIMASTINTDDAALIDLPLPYLEYLNLLNNPEILYETKYNGRKYYVTAKNIKYMSGGQAGSIMLMKPRDELNVIEKEIITKYFMVGILLGIVILALSIIVGRKLLSPTYELARVSLAIAKGKDDVRASISSNDEFSVLAENFNGMLDTIEKQKAEMSKAHQEVLEASNAKDLFIANMSHEFRTPMHSIQSFSELGQKRIDSASKDKLLGYFSRINSSSKRLARLVDDLLDLSKLESGQFRFSFQEADFDEIVSKNLEELASLYEPKHIRMIVHKNSESMQCLIDKDKLFQVVHNLLSNAIKFSPQDSEITLSYGIAKKTVTDNKQDEMLQFSVSDHGVGIPEAELKRVFNKFSQSSVTQNGAGGTGLGLAIAKEIILGHHGKIYAENNAEGGAIFTFSIPVTG